MKVAPTSQNTVDSAAKGTGPKNIEDEVVAEQNLLKSSGFTKETVAKN